MSLPFHSAVSRSWTLSPIFETVAKFSERAITVSQALNRRSKAINVGLADGHMNRVRLPDLWNLQWSSLSVPVNVRTLVVGPDWLLI